MRALRAVGELCLEAEAGLVNFTQTLSPVPSSDPMSLSEDCWSSARMEKEGRQEVKELRTPELQPMLLFLPPQQMPVSVSWGRKKGVEKTVSLGKRLTTYSSFYCRPYQCL